MKMIIRILILILFILIAALSGCSIGPPYPHEFRYGEEVVMKLDGRNGIVIGQSYFDDRVTVRYMRMIEYVEKDFHECELKHKNGSSLFWITR